MLNKHFLADFICLSQYDVTNIPEEKQEGHLGCGILIQMLSTRNVSSCICGVFRKYMMRYLQGRFKRQQGMNVFHARGCSYIMCLITP